MHDAVDDGHDADEDEYDANDDNPDAEDYADVDFVIWRVAFEAL